MSKVEPEWQPPISTALLIKHLSAGRDEPLSWEIEQLVLRRLINTRACDLCNAPYGQLCLIYGGPQNPRRTHPIRLRMTGKERNSTIRWAQKEATERAAARAGEDLAVEDVA